MWDGNILIKLLCTNTEAIKRTASNTDPIFVSFSVSSPVPGLRLHDRPSSTTCFAHHQPPAHPTPPPCEVAIGVSSTMLIRISRKGSEDVSDQYCTIFYDKEKAKISSTIVDLTIETTLYDLYLKLKLHQSGRK
ncbi:hypothetical protein L2E82_00718 [Cichorium intybus]|uniref:Uncharacterized protein n=1 Tax=Cichorium intybus TaxID=13427 RepID=A0ACB9GXX6_CICIN|nr:hypothetical protein L2E82_00718 [Cichorium intybus]